MPEDDQDIPRWAVSMLERLAKIEAKLELLGTAPLVPPVKQGIPAAGLGAGVGGAVVAIVELVRWLSTNGGL